MLKLKHPSSSSLVIKDTWQLSPFCLFLSFPILFSLRHLVPSFLYYFFLFLLVFLPFFLHLLTIYIYLVCSSLFPSYSAYTFILSNPLWYLYFFVFIWLHIFLVYAPFSLISPLTRSRVKDIRLRKSEHLPREGNKVWVRSKGGEQLWRMEEKGSQEEWERNWGNWLEREEIKDRGK